MVRYGNSGNARVVKPVMSRSRVPSCSIQWRLTECIFILQNSYNVYQWYPPIINFWIKILKISLIF